ncbi:MAG: ATP-binding cassette domain-containing protein [Deltaproteobacteria bacterium]|nr:ATP-binding cassette domain-containing protein [Deltaproteobacteria bacterium]
MNNPIIEFKDVSYSFGEGDLRRQVLFSLTGTINTGEVVIVTGPSGSGKTTFLTLIGALRCLQEGSVRLMGWELYGAPQKVLREVRRNIGFIFQLHNLIDALTAHQNLMMGLRLHPEINSPSAAADDILEQVGLGDHINKFPRQLSGGQRQRVAIARALVMRPKVILADEPTASLDGKTGRVVVEQLHALATKQGTTILLVTYDPRILDIADRVLALEDGRFVGMTIREAGRAGLL